MTAAQHSAAILNSKGVAAGNNAAIAFGFESETRNPAPLLAIGAIIAAWSLCPKRGVISDVNPSQESAA